MVPMLMPPEPSDASIARLAQIRLDIERHETEIWNLRAEADELRHALRRAAGPGAQITPQMQASYGR
jgi:hypothetical protein